MKKIGAVIFIVIFFISIMWFKTYIQLNKLQEFKAISPLPDFLTFSTNKQVSTISLWKPFLLFLQGSNKPEISAKSALVYEISTGKVLYEKNSSIRLPMASLTKIMTAIIAFENKKIDDTYVVYSENLVGENSMGLHVGEKLSFEDLLYGLILNSGNDAAEVLASNYSLGRLVFIDAMNNKARALGLSDTHFTNPTGLQGDGNQFTTAHDLLVITKYALTQFPLFEKVTSTFQHVIPQTKNHKEYYLQNEINLISSYPGVKGIKDGYTPEAGLCLVTYLEYKNYKIIAILLGSENRRQEMKDLLDYSLRKLGITPPFHI